MYACLALLPKNVQGLANACLVGSLWLDMLRGRKSEFQSIKGRDVDDMLSQGTDYLVCPDHKNSKTYGSMAKWLTPGARRAVELYRQVPRRPEVQTFLVPAMESISRVDISSAFPTFCSLKLSQVP